MPKPKPGSAPVDLQGPFPDAASFLMALINAPVALDLKLRAAISLLPFQAVRLDERGKKEAAAERAEELAAEVGPFAPQPQPKRPN